MSKLLIVFALFVVVLGGGCATYYVPVGATVTTSAPVVYVSPVCVYPEIPALYYGRPVCMQPAQVYVYPTFGVGLHLRYNYYRR